MTTLTGRVRTLLISMLALAFVPGSAHATPDILIDGYFDDWAAAPLIAGDPDGSTSGLAAHAVYAQSIGTQLYLSFMIGDAVNLPAGETSDGTLLIEILTPSPTNPQQNVVVLSHNARTHAFWAGQPGSSLISQHIIGATYAPTYASTRFEMVMDLAPVGISVNDTIRVRMTGLPISDPFVLAEPAAPEPIRSVERDAQTDFRIFSSNTWNSGLLNSSRRPAFERLVRAFHPDIVALQEEYNSSVGFITSWLNGLDPLEDGRPWNVIKNNDCVIATPYQLLPLPMLEDRYAGGVIVFDDGSSVAVVNMHAKCCGHTGNSDDLQRITTSNLIIETVRRLRDGELGQAYEPHRDAPLVITGDWNLVGSREPLDLIEQSPITNAQAITIPHAVGRWTATWRSFSNNPTFLPGRLDLFAHTHDTLTVRNGFVVNTARFTSQMLADLGLLATDSNATDHFPIVVDYARILEPNCPGDINADNRVDLVDFNILAVNFGTGPGALPEQGDLNNDGFVDLADFNILASNFGAVCSD